VVAGRARKWLDKFIKRTPPPFAGIKFENIYYTFSLAVCWQTKGCTQEVWMGLKKRRKNKPYINEVVLERVSRMRLKKKSLPLAPRFSISFAGQMSWTSVATRAAGPRPLGRPELQLIYLSLDTMLQLYRVYTYSYLTEQKTMLIVGMPNRVKNSSNQGDAICSFTLFYSNQFLWAAVPNL